MQTAFFPNIAPVEYQLFTIKKVAFIQKNIFLMCIFVTSCEEKFPPCNPSPVLMRQDAMANQGGGSLHLAAVPTFATRWLIPRLPDFKTQHPDITVHIETRTRAFMFGETVFDCALFAGTPEQVNNWAGTRATQLLTEEVVPVCSPALPAGKPRLTPLAISRMPLLQQSTRPGAWRQWFDAAGIEAPDALSGPRFEQFSMTAAAACVGLGLALVPRLLIESELTRGDLVVACERPLKGTWAYYLVRPERLEPRPALARFESWLMQAVTSYKA